MLGCVTARLLIRAVAVVPKRRSARQPFTHRPEMQFGDPPIGRRRGSGSDRRFSAHPDSLANIRLLSLAMPECCVGKPEKPVLPCSRHACDEAIAVGRETIATPRHMLIRPDQHEPSTVTVAQTGVCQSQRLKRRFVFSRGFNESSCCARVALCDHQSESLPEMIVERRTVGKPKMRGQAPWMRRRNVKHEMIRRRLTAVGDHDGRIFVPHSKNDSERLELAHFCGFDDVRNLTACRLTDQARLFQPWSYELVAGQSEIVDRFGDRSLMNRAPFKFVRRK